MNITPETVEAAANEAYRTHFYLTQTNTETWLGYGEINLEDQDEETQQFWRALTVAVITYDLGQPGFGDNNSRGYRNGQAAHNAYHLLAGLSTKDWDELVFDQRTNWQRIAANITTLVQRAEYDLDSEDYDD